MKTFSYTDTRNHLGELIDRVAEENEPVRIKRRDGRSVVVLSETEYNGLHETLHLLSSPVNAERLLAARDRGC